MLQERNSADMRPILALAYEIAGEANQTPGLTGVFTTFSASSPQFFLQIDRDKARILNVEIPQIFETLSINLGTAYVNDFNAFGRVYQVQAQADQRVPRQSRGHTEAEGALGQRARWCRSARWSRSATSPGRRWCSATTCTSRCRCRATPRPASPSGDGARPRWRRSRPRRCRPGTSYEWTELALQERQTGNTAIFIFGLSVLFVFLALAAQYESWTMPFAIILDRAARRARRR